MKKTSNKYIMVLPVTFYRIDSNKIAIESSFAEHLKLLKKSLTSIFEEFIILLISMNYSKYNQIKNSLIIINEQEEGIYFESIFEEDIKNKLLSLATSLVKIKQIYKFIKASKYVHTGIAFSIYSPLELIAVILAKILDKKITFVVDIDFRNSSYMLYKTGNLSLKSYLLSKYIYDPFYSLQIKLAINFGALALLKGRKLTKDFGKGKNNVKNFLDIAYCQEYIIKEEILQEKLSKVKEESNPLELIYFGRLTSYKGIIECIKAVSLALQQNHKKIKFTIMGTGEQKEELQLLTQQLKLEDIITFQDSIVYGVKLFEELYKYHLLLAAPLREDTPRSVFDAMAAGVPTLAFNTYYYQDLEFTGAVTVVPWLSIEELANKIIYLDDNRKILTEMMGNAVNFAQENTQEIWLENRRQWTLENLAISNNKL